MPIDPTKVVWDEDAIDPTKVTWDKETPILAPRDLARSTTEVTGLAGTQVEPETFLGRVAEAWETGELQTELGILGYRKIIGEDLPEIENRITEIQSILPTEPRKKRGIPERAVTFVTGQIPLMASGMKKGTQRGLTLGLGAAAITAVAGQVGPQAVLPEEVITVPSAFTAMFGVGMLSGTIENISQIEAGLAYIELRDLKDAKGNKIDPVITKSAAAGVGLINGLIELAQIKLLLKTIPGGEALLRGAIRKATTKAVSSKTLHSIALRAARRHAGFVTGETAQEVAQESTNILANETVKFFSNEIQKKTEIPYTTRKEITDRLLTIAEESAIGFTLMGVPGQVATITGEVVRPEAPIPVKAELVEKGMPEEEKTEPTIVRQQKVAQKESQKQAFLTKIAQDVADPDNPLTAAEVALMGQYVPEELEISQQELNRAAAKGIQTTVIGGITEEVAKAGEKILVPEPEIAEIEVPEPEITEIEVEEPEIVEEEIPAEEVEIVEPEALEEEVPEVVEEKKVEPTTKEIDTAAKQAELEAKLAAAMKPKGFPAETEILPEELKGVPDFMKLAEKRGFRPGVSQSATEWGVIATPEQIELAKEQLVEVKAKAEALRTESKKARAAGDTEKANRLLEEYGEYSGTQPQGLREAIEASEGIWPGQKTITIRERAEVKPTEVKPAVVKEPHKMSQKEFIDYHATGTISEQAYKQYETLEGVAWLGKKEKYPIKIKSQKYGDEVIELRKSDKKLQYVKQDKEGNIVRDKKGLATYMTEQEIKQLDVPLTETSIVAFNSKGQPIGWAANEFGTDGVWVINQYQKRGIGNDLLTEFRKQFKPTRKMGQMTGSGLALIKAHHRRLAKQAISEGKITSHPDYPELGKKPKKVVTVAKPKAVAKRRSRYLTNWIVETGGVRDVTLPGELRDLITDVDKKGRLKRARGVPPGFLNKKGRGLDEIVDEARSAGFAIEDVDDLLAKLEQDMKASMEGDVAGRITVLTDEARLDKMWDDYLEYAREQDGLTEREAIEKISREAQDQAAEEIAREKEFADRERAAIQAESNQIAPEVGPAQETLIKKEAPFELKGEEPPPKLVGPLGKKAVFPTEKIRVGPRGEQVSLIKRKGEQVTIGEKIEEKETRLALAGVKAIGVPKGTLAKAQKMLAKGQDEKIVWRKTGWMRGVEGKWKFEIDDSGAKLNVAKLQPGMVGGTLGDWLDHPALYKAYPELKSMLTTISRVMNMKAAKGNYTPAIPREGEGLVDLAPEIEIFGPSADEIKSALFHEIQHAIQDIEGFAVGGSPAMMAQALVNKETRYLEKTNEAYRALSQKIITLYFDGYKETSEPVKMHRRQQQKIFDEHVTKKYGEEHPSLALYKRLAGEIEARTVSDRMFLTAEDRMEMVPYAAEPIERKDWIITDGKGTSFSVDPSLVAEPTGYKFTKRQQKNLIEVGTLVPGWLKRAGADEEILKNITLELKPFIDLRGKDVDKTLKDWEKEGVDAGTILGATTFENYHALIQLAINGQTLGKLEKSTYHEWYHVAKAWMLPRSDIEALGKHFKTEESEADAFAKYMKDAKAIDTAPGLIKRLFLKLKRMITIIRNGLKGKGFNRPEDIFGSIRVGAYKPTRLATKPITAVGIKPEVKLAVEKKPPTISKEETAAEKYVQEALGKVKETKVVELEPTEKITGAAYDKIAVEEAQNSIEDLIAKAKDDERLIHHVRSTLKKAMSIGKKAGIAKQKAHYQEVVARAKARKEKLAQIRKMIDQLKALDIEKLSPQEKQPVGDLLAGINLVKPTKRIIARLTNTRRYLEDNPDVELPEYVMENLKRLDKRNIRDMSIEDIESLHKAVMHYVHLNKLKGIIKVRRESKRKAEVLNSSIGEMKAPKKVKSEIVSSQKSKLGRTKKTAKLITDTFGIRHDHYDLVIESLSGVNSTMDKVLYQDVKDGITEQLKYKQETYADFLKDLGDISAKYGISDISNWLNEEVTTGKFRFTRGERMALLRHALNRDNLRHLLAGGFGFRTSETPNKRYMISAKELNQVLQSLTPAEKHFAGPAVNNLFERQYKALNKVFYAKNNYELPKTRDPYYPIEVMSITLGKDLETVEALEKFKGRWTRIGLEKGMLEKRVKSKKPIYLNSIVFDINRSVMKSAAYVGLEIPLSNASKLLYDRTFRAELESRYGKQTWREIEKGLRDIAGDYQSYTTVEEWLLKRKNNLAVAMLGVNPFVMTKQVLSLPIYLPYVKLEYLLQGMIDFTITPTEIGERHKMYSPEYLERVEGGYSRDVADVFKSAAAKRLYAGKTTIKEKFMGGIQLFDRVAVSAGMQGAVLQVLDEFDQGKLSREVKLALDLEDTDIAKLTPEKRMALAYKFADYATERTQPMFSPEHRSSLSRGATVEKLATMFGSFTNQALNLMRRTYREARRTGEPAAYVKFGKVLFLILVVNTLGVMAIDEIRDRITKKKKKPSVVARILNTWTGYMFFVRDLANSVISKIERGTFAGYDVQLPIQRVPELLSNVLANAVKAFSDETPAKRKKAAMRFFDDGLNLVLMYNGIPYQTPKRLIAGVVKPEEKKAKY